MLQTSLYYLQRFGLSTAFFVMAYPRAVALLDRDAWLRAIALLATRSPLSQPALVLIQQVTQNLLLIAFNLLVGVLLLTLRRPTRAAERPAHVLVPFVATFSYLAYGVAEQLPAPLRDLRLLPDPGPAVLLLSGLLVTGAYLLSFGALLFLRRSFAVFVEVRRGVMSGPYRTIRHPMYLGYFMVVLALFLAQPSGAYALISLVLVAITVFRARLEEQMLVDHVPGYAGYAKSTGMFLPRLRRPPAP